MSESDQRAAVVAEARSWLRTPYQHHARVKGAGVDCGQILIAVYADAGVVADFDPGEYPSDWMFHRDQERYLGFVTERCRPVETPKPGDIVLFKFGRCISHGGIVTAWPEIIHAYHGHGVILDNVEQNPKLHSRLAGVYSPW
jgi:NlpC/P60 family putative phage cell wall peptidase